MSYATSSFVHTAQPTAEIAVSEKKAIATPHTDAAVKKEITTKIVLFVAILACLVLAVTI